MASNSSILLSRSTLKPALVKRGELSRLAKEAILDTGALSGMEIRMLAEAWLIVNSEKVPDDWSDWEDQVDDK